MKCLWRRGCLWIVPRGTLEKNKYLLGQHFLPMIILPSIPTTFSKSSHKPKNLTWKLWEIKFEAIFKISRFYLQLHENVNPVLVIGMPWPLRSTALPKNHPCDSFTASCFALKSYVQVPVSRRLQKLNGR